MNKKAGLFTMVAVFAASLISTFILDKGVITFEESFTTLTSASVLALVTTGWVKVSLKLKDGAVRILSWLVAIALGFIAQLLGYGIFDSLSWGEVILTGFGVGLISNGVASAETIKLILGLIWAQLKKEK